MYHASTTFTPFNASSTCLFCSQSRRTSSKWSSKSEKGTRARDRCRPSAGAELERVRMAGGADRNVVDEPDVGRYGCEQRREVRFSSINKTQGMSYNECGISF